MGQASSPRQSLPTSKRRPRPAGHLAALQATPPGKFRGWVRWRRPGFRSLPDRQIDDQLAELGGVARTLGTTVGHSRSMVARVSRASGAEFQTEALPDVLVSYSAFGHFGLVGNLRVSFWRNDNRSE